VPSLQIIPLESVPEVQLGDDLGALIAEGASAGGHEIRTGDCLVVTQKVVSKAEGRLVPLVHHDLDARRALIESESVRVLRRRDELMITETAHGFVCANAGIDLSNVDDGLAALLPVDGDRSAHRIRNSVRARHGADVAVVVSDTFGRAWRNGLTDVAIGVAGIAGVVDLRGSVDSRGQELRVTEVAIADEIAGAAELVMGKASGVPVAIVRGLPGAWLRDGSVRELVRAPGDDLFR
jgi:coenzyme F420-0:L-glutamate ligase/coenzyme F420-1:gamma-L-glutamate ligase